jgi:hypothetical protein
MEQFIDGTPAQVMNAYNEMVGEYNSMMRFWNT